MIDIVEIFKSVQGEGSQAGRPVIFVRFAGCNRQCLFCDTDREIKMKIDSLSIANIIENIQPECTYIVFTGGEPLLHKEHFPKLISLIGERISFVQFGIETNGSLFCPAYFSYVSLSPKVHRADCRLDKCDSLKILYPYIEIDGSVITASEYENFHALNKYIQPIEIDGKIDYQGAIAEVERLGYPWKLGVQLHKLIGVK